MMTTSNITQSPSLRAPKPKHATMFTCAVTRKTLQRRSHPRTMLEMPRNEQSETVAPLQRIALAKPHAPRFACCITSGSKSPNQGKATNTWNTHTAPPTSTGCKTARGRQRHPFGDGRSWHEWKTSVYTGSSSVLCAHLYWSFGVVTDRFELGRLHSWNRTCMPTNLFQVATSFNVRYRVLLFKHRSQRRKSGGQPELNLLRTHSGHDTRHPLVHHVTLLP